MSMAAYLTNAGLAVLNKVMASHGPLTFVKAQLGSGQVTEEKACRLRTSLMQPICDATLVSAKYEGGEAKISIQYNNAGLTKGFFVNEVGLFVQDPDSSNLVLYCYATFGETPDWIAPASSANYTRAYDILTIVSNVSSVNVTVSPSALVSYADFTAQMNIVDTTLLAIATENSMVNRDTQEKVNNAVASFDAQYGNINAAIANVYTTLRAEMASQKTTMEKAADVKFSEVAVAINAVMSIVDPVIRDLKSRLETAEAQLAALS